MDLKSIHEIFSNRILRIPSYQRGYSWSNNKPFNHKSPEENQKLKGQLVDLWNDIKNIPDGKWHYTGLLTLVKVSESDYPWLNNHKQYAIVDGQQRITTILILISIIIEEVEKIDGFVLGLHEDEKKNQYLYVNKQELKAYVFGYDQDNPSDKYFRRYILNLDEIEDNSKESVYTENLKKSRKYFSDVVNEYISGEISAKKEKLEELFNKVTSNLKLNEYVLPDELDEYVVFETMNNRGKALSELEKLKNRLMYLNDKFTTDGGKEDISSVELLNAKKKGLGDSINKAWITIYQELGSNKEHPLDDEDFIKNHWIAYFDRYSRKEAGVYANHLFGEYFTLENVYNYKLQNNDINNYVKSLQKCSVIWNKIHNPSYFDDNETEWKRAVRGIHQVDFRSSFKPLILAVLADAQDKKYLSLINLLEAYAFKLFHVSDRQSNTGDSKLYRLASRIYKKDVSAVEACNEIQEHVNYYYKYSLFESQMKELFETGKKEGFYGWSGLKYFLYKYDRMLRKSSHTSTKSSELDWEDFKTKNSIEHIYPQSAAKNYEKFSKNDDTAERRKAYEKLQSDWSGFSDYNSDERRCFCNSLGNLLAISSSDNSSFSNDPFKYKVDQSSKGKDYKNRGYCHDSMSAQIVSKEEGWGPKEIIKRGVKMINYMLTFLGESEGLLSENSKLELLGLDFLVKTPPE